MSAISGGERIVLSGPPHNTKAVMRGDTAEATLVAVRLDIAGEASLHRAHVRPLGPGTTELRLQLPRQTPAGTYRGEVKLDDGSHAVIVHVVTNARTRIVPKRTALTAEPGGRAEFELIVSNDGNVVVDIAKAATFDLDDGEGQDRALGVALRADLAEDENRIDRFFDELRRVHGGEGRVNVLDGAGPLEPGEARTVRCRVEVPMTTQTGRAYLGSWMVGSTSHVLAVTVEKPSSPRNGRQGNSGRNE